MYGKRAGVLQEESTGEMIPTQDIVFAETAQAVLAALSVESVRVRRRILDRHGRQPVAYIEYTPTDFAAKLGDGYDFAYGSNGGAIEERG